MQYSLSRALDSIKQQKLIKARFVYNPSFSKKYSIHMPQREVLLEIKKVEIQDMAAVKSMLERFKKDSTFN
jgi:hypothetical protein